ncbi:MBL fold metallo-hydrolase [Selenomonas bovis]|uniref:MBL fold metallo-hydrolase n=1 Tax=Selenomonas bovis TaxID=416586 RepID=A0A848BCD8_9FIRM|nr:MBL fold metallo-hydrolase [Selenomonas bovis]NMD99744.1 MBL fold metallo-hydrolase [Selenomonas bovis]
MQVSVLASGSKGNAVFVAMDGVRLLIDAGISATRIKKALAAEGVDAADLDAVLITHEHSDHIAGLRTLTKWYQLPIYSRRATLAQLPPEIPEALRRETAGAFRIAGVQIMPFSIPHDAADPVGYRITGTRQVTTCTDLGFVTSSVQAALDGADVLVLEANHDPAVLKEGRYPWPLKRRILGTRGHLANADAAWAIARLQKPPQQVFLAHLSAENNRPELARETVATILARQGIDVPLAVASQEQPVRLHC